MPETVPTIPDIWFERLNRKVGLPTWAGAIVFGAGPFFLLGTATLALPGNVEDFLIITAMGATLVLVISLFTFYTGRYLKREITDLMEYARSLLNESVEGTSLSLSNFASVKRSMIAYAILLAFSVPLFSLGGTRSLAENLAGEIPFLWFNFIFATFFWTFGYSMYSIYRMGKLPFKLKPYTQDRTLGLKPFASASLNSTLIYMGVTTSVVVPVLFGGAIPFGLALLFLTLYPIGLVLFLFPLRSLHAKLVEAKREALARIAPRYEKLLDAVNSGARVDQEVANEMAVVDKIQRDIQQIHTWPFDTGVIARLLAIMITVSGILLSGLIRSVLRF